MAANVEEDQPELHELAAFVNELARRARYPSSAAWARDASYHYPNLSRLRAGKAGITGVNLVKLIKAAAARINEDEAAFALAAPPSPGELREAVVRLEAVVARLSAHLGGPPNTQAHGGPP